MQSPRTLQIIYPSIRKLIYLIRWNLYCIGSERWLVGCRGILHRFANEDVSLGAWLIGLEVQHVDEPSMCCGTPPGM